MTVKKSYHEAGHSIVKRLSRDEMLIKAAGNAAEELVFGRTTTMCLNDMREVMLMAEDIDVDRVDELVMDARDRCMDILMYNRLELDLEASDIFNKFNWRSL